MPPILKKMWINIEINRTIATAATPFRKRFITSYFLSAAIYFPAGNESASITGCATSCGGIIDLPQNSISEKTVILSKQS